MYTIYIYMKILPVHHLIALQVSNRVAPFSKNSPPVRRIPKPTNIAILSNLITQHQWIVKPLASVRI